MEKWQVHAGDCHPPLQEAELANALSDGRCRCHGVQEQKSVSSFFWFGLGFNIFAGNVVAITQQVSRLSWAVCTPLALSSPVL